MPGPLPPYVKCPAHCLTNDGPKVSVASTGNANGVITQSGLIEDSLTREAGKMVRLIKYQEPQMVRS